MGTVAADLDVLVESLAERSARDDSWGDSIA